MKTLNSKFCLLLSAECGVKEILNSNFIKNLPPISTILKLLAAWVVLAVFNYILIKAGLEPGTSKYFPISEVMGPLIHFSGLPYALLFLIILFIALKHYTRFGIFQVWLIGLSLIILGNLSQGSFEDAFIKPITGEFFEYYHDAIKITDWREWLNQFNIRQPFLFMHSRVHPPFVVLLYYFLFKSFGLISMASILILLASLSIVLVWQIMRTLGLTVQQSSLFALLFSVIPSYNIYSAITLESIIGMGCTLFLLGTVKIVVQRANLQGIFLVVAGILLTNMLTFVGAFLIATAGLLAIRETFVSKRYEIWIALLISLASGILLYFTMLYYYGYDHVNAFLTAAKFENPHGFRLLYNPVNYVMTRIEDVAEIALFLSLGVLASLFHSNYLKSRLFDLRDSITSISLAGPASLLLMFLAGAFISGETARLCIFIYPYILLSLRNLHESQLRSLIAVAGLQTIMMQLFTDYYY